MQLLSSPLINNNLKKVIMKTIEEKAKAYDKALEKAEKALEVCGTDKCETARQIFSLFPELKDSEDERIRKEIISAIKEDWPGHTDWIAWLEKQDNESVNIDIESMVSSYEQRLKSQGQGNLENNPLINMCVSAFRRGVENTLEELNLKKLEKQGVQKSVDKEYTFKSIPRLLDMIEPTDRVKSYCKKLIDSLQTEGYSVDAKIVGECLKQMNGEKVAMAIMDTEKQDEQQPIDKVEPKFKVGDWITNGDYTWKIVEVKPLDYILQSQDGNIVDDTIFHVDEQFHLFTIQDAKDGDVLASELCDSIILFKGINDDNNIDFYCDYDFSEIDLPGDRFSVNNGQHYGNVEDSKDFHPATKEQRDTLMKAVADAGYIFDFEKKELKKIEQEPAWSKEDERMYRELHNLIYSTPYCDSRKELSDWLKSLKDRCTWKPSDEQMKALKGVQEGVFRLGILESLYNDLKRLLKI